MKKVKFKKELLFTVRAESENFAVCTRPINRKKDKQLIKHLSDEDIENLPIYTIIDYRQKIRAPHNRLFNNFDFRKDEDCQECLKELEEGIIEVSQRNKVPLIIECFF